MDIRKVQLIGTSRFVSIPQGMFEKGDALRVDIIDEKSIKLTKIEE